MKKEIADRWVAALRSGEYEQVRGRLRVIEADEEGQTGGFCCLGVLCDLHDEPGFAWKGTRYQGPGDGEVEVLPKTVKKWAGMRFADGALPGGSALASMNDEGMTFAGLADVIEANWKAL